MEWIISLIISQCRFTLSRQVEQLKYTQFLFVKYNTIKLEKIKYMLILKVNKRTMNGWNLWPFHMATEQKVNRPINA